MNTAFWKTTALSEMTPTQWESVCDGCGKCCLHKLEDEDDGEVYYTDVACRYLNCEQGRCNDYSNRLHNVAECLNLTPQNLPQYSAWLPSSCAYRLLYLSQALPDWHPLISGDKASVKMAGASVAGKVIPEQDYLGDLEDRIVHWVDDVSYE